VFRGLVAALVLALALTLSAVAPVLGDDPSSAPSPGASPVLIDPLDPRAGAGTDELGSPFMAVVVVFGVGVLALASTLVYVRMTRRA